MENDNKLPRNVFLVYQYMYNNRIMEDSSIVFRGYGADIASGTNIKTYLIYRYISMLEILGSIKKLRHGAANSPSVYLLIKEPDGHEYDLMKDRSIMTGRDEMPSKSTRLQDSLNRLVNRLNDVERRLERLENDRHNV